MICHRRSFVLLTVVISLPLSFANEDSCSYSYDVVPKSPMNCNPLGVNITFTCHVTVPRGLPTAVRWYYSRQEGECGRWIRDEFELKTLRKILLTDPPGIYARYELTIHNFSSDHNGSYWCQMVANGTVLLDPSRAAHVAVNNNSEHCGWLYQHNPIGDICAHVVINSTCELEVPTSTVLVATEVTIDPYTTIMLTSLSNTSTSFSTISILMPPPETTTHTYSSHFSRMLTHVATVPVVTTDCPPGSISNYYLFIAIGGGGVLVSICCFFTGCLAMYVCTRRNSKKITVHYTGNERQQTELEAVVPTGSRDHGCEIKLTIRDRESPHLSSQLAINPAPLTEDSLYVLPESVDHGAKDQASSHKDDAFICIKPRERSPVTVDAISTPNHPCTSGVYEALDQDRMDYLSIYSTIS